MSNIELDVKENGQNEGKIEMKKKRFESQKRKR